MQFIDLNRQFKEIEDDVCSRVVSVLKGQKYIFGPEITELEQKLAEYAGAKHALTCSSGTDALVIPLMAYDLKPTDAVFVPSFTFFASAESVSLAGGTPVFVDSDPSDFNISIASLEAAIKNTIEEGELAPRGIIPVDLFGQPANYREIAEIADKYGLFVLEDAAQGFGATYHGSKTCSFGNVAATSFFPAKPLGCYGDGGAIFTNDDELAATMRSIRVHGQGTDKYDNVRMGVNGRMDTIQAAVILAKMEIFDNELKERDRVAKTYESLLSGMFEVPQLGAGKTSAWAQYTLLAKDKSERDVVLEGMKARNIPIMVYYPIPIHLSTAYQHLGYEKGSLPVCEDLADRVFSVPMHPYLSEEDIQTVASSLKEVVRG